jgi:hypothetical protein
MKNVVYLAAIAALCFGTSAYAAPDHETFDVRIVTSTGDTSVQVAPGGTVDIVVQGYLDTNGVNATDGLALFGVNVSADGDYDADLCTDITFVAAAGMSSFVKNDGLTNPDGYGGTCNPAPSVDSQLWQLGGGQNTINNNSGNAPYPTGAVVTGIGNSGTWEDLATGTLAIDAGAVNGTSTVLTLDTPFANTIDAGQSGPVYDVSPIDSRVIEGLTINIGSGIPAVQIVSAVSRRDHGATLDQDIAIDVNGQLANGDVSSEPRESGVLELWVEFTAQPGTGAPADVTIESATTASPVYAPYAGPGTITGVTDEGSNWLRFDMSGFNVAETYRFTFGGNLTSTPDSLEVRMLWGDCDGGSVPATYGAVEVADKVVLFANWGGYTIRTDLNTDGATDVTDKTQLFARWGSTAP